MKYAEGKSRGEKKIARGKKGLEKIRRRYTKKRRRKSSEKEEK